MVLQALGEFRVPSFPDAELKLDSVYTAIIYIAFEPEWTNPSCDEDALQRARATCARATRHAVESQQAGGFWCIIADENASCWHESGTRELHASTDVFSFYVDMCCFGFGRRGRTRIATSCAELRRLQCRCDNDVRPHQHNMRRGYLLKLLPDFVDMLVDTLITVPKVAVFLDPTGPPRRRNLTELTLLRPCHTYVGRGDARKQLLRSSWANPYPVRSCSSRHECLQKFRKHLHDDASLRRRLVELRRRVLVCHCRFDEPCHADLLRSAFLQQSFLDIPPPFAEYFDWEIPTAKRKRRYGQLAPEPPPPLKRRLASGTWTTAAGGQPRRTGHAPLLEKEVHPGEAIQLLTSRPHPFHVPPPLPDDLRAAIKFTAGDISEIRSWRRAKLAEWKHLAEQLMPGSLSDLANHPDRHLRNLHIFQPKGKQRTLGDFMHIRLWQAVHSTANSPDLTLCSSMFHGFPVAGSVHRSNVWSLVENASPPILTEEELAQRAWEAQRRIREKVARQKGGSHATELWNDAIAEVTRRHAVGPFWDPSEVSSELGTAQWIPMPRFPVVQTDKVRAVDDASRSGSMTNMATSITEKLQVPTTDINIAVVKSLNEASGGADLSAWVLDESKAYRQVGVRPDHRRYCVFVTYDPDRGRLAWFILIGHAFGLTAAVYNYNRRAALLTSILGA